MKKFKKIEVKWIYKPNFFQIHTLHKKLMKIVFFHESCQFVTFFFKFSWLVFNSRS